MASIQSLASGRKDLLMVDPRIIHQKPGFNKRHETQELEAHIRMLADSIKQIGVQNPLTIYMENDQIFVADGHCRRKAALLAIDEGAEIKAVPCLVAPKGATEADLVADMLTRNSGKAFTPLEVADVASQLMGWGWSIEQIADRSGLSSAWINKLLDLRAAPQTLKDDVQTGRVAPSLAAHLVASKGGAKAAEIVAEAKVRTGKERVTKKDLATPASTPRQRPAHVPMSVSLLQNICSATTPEALEQAIQEGREYIESEAWK